MRASSCVRATSDLTPLANSPSRKSQPFPDARPLAVERDSAPAQNCPTGGGMPLPQLINPRAAAALLGRSANTLKRWRYEGVGPDYVVIEGRVSYDLAVLRDYIAKNTRVPSVRASWEATRGAL